MQFSVIVEGSVSGKPDSGSWDELELYLQSAKISPALLKQLQPGQPRILKNSLSYEQAVSISDRLADLGLESAIDPPIKPERDEPAQLHADSRTRPTKAANVTEADKFSAASSPTPRSTRDSVLRPATTPRAKTQHSLPPPAISKAAREVRGLFSLPSSGTVQVTLPRASRLRLCCRAALAVVIPGLPIVLLVASVFAIGSLGFALYAIVANVSPLAAGVLLMAYTLTGLAGLALLTLPFWFGATGRSKPIVLKAKDDPRLIVLINGICKLLNAPSPSHIYLSAEPQVRSSLSCTIQAFFGFSKPLEGELSLYLGSPSLASLNIRELSALIARECGRFADPSFRRPYLIITAISCWLQACSGRKSLMDQFSRSTQRIKPEILRTFIHSVLRGADQIQGHSLRTIAFCESQVSALLLRQDAIADCYQKVMLGEASSTLQRTLGEVKSAHQEALRSMFQENNDQRYVDSLAVLTRGIFQGSQAARKRSESATTGLVKSTRIASALLANFERQDQALTRDFYQSKGLNTSSLRFMSVEELRRRESNEAKLRKIARRYYGSWLHPEQFWKMPSETFSERAEPKILMSRLNHCISRVRFMSPDRPQLIANSKTVRKHLTELKAAKKIVAAGTSFRFQYCADAADDLDRQIATRAAKLRQHDDDLRQQNLVMGERIALGLALDQQHRPTIARILKALAVLDSVAGRLSELSMNLEELSILHGYKPKTLTQHYQLHLKDLNQSTESTYRFISRKLQQCPYEFYDRRYPNLQALLDSRTEHAVAKKPEMTLIDRAKVLEDTVRQAHLNISELAATYAARMEKACGIESVKRV